MSRGLGKEGLTAFLPRKAPFIPMSVQNSLSPLPLMLRYHFDISALGNVWLEGTVGNVIDAHVRLSDDRSAKGRGEGKTP